MVDNPEKPRTPDPVELVGKYQRTRVFVFIVVLLAAIAFLAWRYFAER